MADGILGLGSGQAASLNSELIEKLKTAERKSAVAPIETKITNIATEKDTFAKIQTKVNELLDAVKPFDLFVSGGVTAFEQKSATTSGDSVTFDAADVKSLKNGATTVNIGKLAQKDVYQTETFTSKDTIVGAGNLTIGEETFDTNNKTYQQLADEITAKSGMNASVEQVDKDSFRLVIKSEESGTANELKIGGDASSTLGLDLTENHMLTAQDMEATVDGVKYSVSTNTLTVDGLKITANKVDSKNGDVFTSGSSINVVQDNTQLATQMQNFVTKYNDLVAMVDSEAYNSDSSIQDKSSIRNIVSQIKDKLFGSYGASNDKSVFNYGFELDKSGSLLLDTTKFNVAVQKDPIGLKDLFVGTAEKKGLGTTLKETLDDMRFSGGVLNLYESSMSRRETTLTADKTKAEDALNAKYAQLALQFSAYGAIINQMESSFGGLKMLINQSTSNN
ncbi:MAG: flagellar filament capping protein FliD [Arcobacteraceae bacterium]